MGRDLSQGEETVTKEKPATLHRSPSMDNNRSKRKFVVYGGALLVWYNVLVQVLRFKYVGKKVTPFETQTFLIKTSILTFVVAGLTLPLLIQDYLSKSPNRPFSPGLFKMIKIVFSVTVAVANVTLLLILILD